MSYLALPMTEARAATDTAGGTSVAGRGRCTLHNMHNDASLGASRPGS